MTQELCRRGEAPEGSLDDKFDVRGQLRSHTFGVAGAGGGVSELPAATIDVREMLCAQALAVVAQAVERLPAGGWLAIAYNAEDVRQDVAAWAHSRGHRLDTIDSTTLRLRRA